LGFGGLLEKWKLDPVVVVDLISVGLLGIFRISQFLVAQLGDIHSSLMKH
jgi:hypothetical protein